MSGPPVCPYTDLILLHRRFIHKLKELKWCNLPASYASDYRQLSPKNHRQSWFHNLNINHHLIVLYFRLRLGHNLLPKYSFYLRFNQSPYWTHSNCYHNSCDFRHLLLNCPSLSYSRSYLKWLFLFYNTKFSFTDAISSNNRFRIKAILHFILCTGLKI